MQKINQNELKNLQKIAESIHKLKNLKILDLNDGERSFSSIFIVEDILTNIQYALKIISISDGYDDINQEKLENAKKEADFLMQCDHPNVVKYIDSFQISSNYFILIEKCEKNLEQWIEDQNKTAISRHQLTSFACQILSSIQYFHKNNYVLTILSLKNILIDRYNQIKIFDFVQAEKLYSEINSQQFMKSLPKDEMFYIPPEIINQSKEQMSNTSKGFEQMYQVDIWGFGICFSILGGATYKDCLQFHISGHTYMKQIDEDFNQILSKTLSLQPNERLNIQQLIKEFEILKQKIWNPQQANILFSEYLQNRTNNALKALELILICVDISPQNTQYLKEQGYIQSRFEYFDEVIKSYQKCLEINPQNVDCYYDLGIMFQSNEMEDESIKSFEKCIEINPQNDKCHFNLGNVQFDKGMVDEAIKSYQKCIEINPHDEDYHNNLGSTYLNKGMVDEAIQSFQKGLEINPQNDIFYNNIGSAYLHKGMVDEAIKSYQKCIEINPEYQDCYFNLGNAYKNKGLMDEGIKQFQKCLKINPEDDNCYYNLGKTYKNKSMIDEAIISFQKCIEINPYDDTYHFNLGDAYYEKGMIDKAIKQFQKCIELNPGDQDVFNEQILLCKQNI